MDCIFKVVSPVFSKGVPATRRCSDSDCAQFDWGKNVCVFLSLVEELRELRQAISDISFQR